MILYWYGKYLQMTTMNVCCHVCQVTPTPLHLQRREQLKILFFPFIENLTSQNLPPPWWLYSWLPPGAGATSSTNRKVFLISFNFFILFFVFVFSFISALLHVHWNVSCACSWNVCQILIVHESKMCFVISKVTFYLIRYMIVQFVQCTGKHCLFTFYL